MEDCLLLVDVFNDFDHEDGDALFASFESRFPNVLTLLTNARDRGVPVVYANDPAGIFDGDSRRVVDRALAGGASRYAAQLVPATGDRFVVKPRYSAFDSTPLRLILQGLEIDRVVLAGMSTEGCVAQTAIAAREEGLKVTVVASACATVNESTEEIALAYLERVVGVRVIRDTRSSGGVFEGERFA